LNVEYWDFYKVIMDGLTKEEAAIYDRQLRVWGVEAQQRLVDLCSDDCYFSMILD